MLQTFFVEGHGHFQAESQEAAERIARGQAASAPAAAPGLASASEIFASRRATFTASHRAGADEAAADKPLTEAEVYAARRSVFAAARSLSRAAPGASANALPDAEGVFAARKAIFERGTSA